MRAKQTEDPLPVHTALERAWGARLAAQLEYVDWSRRELARVPQRTTWTINGPAFLLHHRLLEHDIGPEIGVPGTSAQQFAGTRHMRNGQACAIIEVTGIPAEFLYRISPRPWNRVHQLAIRKLDQQLSPDRAAWEFKLECSTHLSDMLDAAAAGDRQQLPEIVARVHQFLHTLEQEQQERRRRAET